MEFKSLINDGKSSAVNGNISLAKLLKDKINERMAMAVIEADKSIVSNKNMNKNEMINDKLIS